MQSEDYTPVPLARCHRLACHDPFWPPIELEGLRNHLQLSVPISDARLEVAALAAAHKAADEFAQWRRVLRARGYKRLADLASHERLSRCYLLSVQAHTRRTLEQCLQVVECLPGGQGELGYE
ncbi:head completion/stabilization protein [Pseudomonas sp. GZD-222]|uniref:head completion/stabilization protein n=1 Tax=Pseudomonas sp. GZD-222 TaxID=3404805 RepID=UPI003BB4BD7D